MRALIACLCFGAASLGATSAHAQVTSSILVNPKLPDFMLPYQELPVSEQGDGVWSAIGIHAGAFKVLPEVSVGQNFTSNAYVASNGIAAAYETLELDVKARSQWSRHSLEVDGNRQFDLYVGRKDRNTDQWSLKSAGEIDVTNADQITVNADINRVVFNALTSGDVLGSDAIVAYRYDHVAIGATRTFGAGRFLVQAERYHVNFLSTSGAANSYIDHDYYQASAQGEYSLSPMLTVFSRFSYVKTDYGDLANRNGNSLNSRGSRLILGARTAVAGLGRATVAIAYSHRTYDKAGTPNVGGLSAQARAELFVSPLTTVTGEVGSRIVDTQLISTSAVREKYVQLSVDHALMRNFKLKAESRQIWQDALLAGEPSRLLGIAFRGDYLATRRFVISARISYSNRTYTQVNARPGISELNGGLTVTYRI